MRKIILASKSKARQKLLKQMGIPFRVSKSRIKESSSTSAGKNPSHLVKNNALRKAQDVAARTSSGIVIAADTVVSAEGKIIGKPKNIADAFFTIKLLTRKPQWVYTGLAVIDIDRQNTYITHEKTKIYMYPLTDRQIRRYLRNTSPLDKAGSFDIQGRGGIFIDRIEGCFYNVVGLPLAKLARILTKIGIEIF